MILLVEGLTSLNQWKDKGGRLFLPVRVLSRLFRGKYLAELKALWKSGNYDFMEAVKFTVIPAGSSDSWTPAMRRNGFLIARRPSMECNLYCHQQSANYPDG
ncbi:transposase [uncultured Dysosmobacter sp.]|uniref:transposase n=1 Tax=uncultured Dysosmobacter sp. TaxID=2591384 RepID=UPI00261C818D|nr:transposase [uncultured Dysosmobacter sp.]